MDADKEAFIFREFLVGLVVIVILLVLLLWGLQKLTGPDFMKKLFAKKPGVNLTLENYCDLYQLGGVTSDKKPEYERIVKRSGWLDTKYRYTLAFNNVSKNKIPFEITSSSSEVPKEVNALKCEKEGMLMENPDKLLVTGFLNVYPGKLDEYAVYKVGERKGFQIAKDGLKEGQVWTSQLNLKGGLNLSGSTPEEKYCFSLEAKGTTAYKGIEKVQTVSGEIEGQKIETVWEGTPSANLATRKKLEECYQSNISFDNSAKVSFKDEVWFAKDLGVVKRQITPLGVTGQVYFLPNGYLPLEISDTLVSR